MKTIVLVDDKESIAKVIAYYISKEFNIKYFNNPLKAMAGLQDGNIQSLIISDIRMLEMTGDKFLIYPKNNNLFIYITVVMLSGRDGHSVGI